MVYHVAYVRRDSLNKLLTGRKCEEVRLSKRMHPARGCQRGDFLLLRDSETMLVIAAAPVVAVSTFEDLTPYKVAELWVKYGSPDAASEAYWLGKLHSRYAVVIHLDEVRAIQPFKFHTKPPNRMGWFHNFEPAHRFDPAFSPFNNPNARASS